jgi:hypothetical protein
MTVLFHPWGSAIGRSGTRNDGEKPVRNPTLSSQGMAAHRPPNAGFRFSMNAFTASL